MDHLLALLYLLANAITCTRLLIYRRDGARFRPLVSIAAWVLIASTGGGALGLLVGLYPPTHVHLSDLGMAVVLCVLSLTARGDVAAILRTDHDPKSSYSARG